MERRLAAVMIADVVGYGRLSQIDEEGTRARFRSDLQDIFEPQVAEHHGRLVKTMGDGLLVEFRSVVDAVRCAIDVQRAEAKRNAALPDDRNLVFRIGINLGDVIVEGDDIHGDGVNIADRLQTVAEPGSIAISGSAHEQVKTKVAAAYTYVGEQKVKNVSEPVRVYRVAAAGTAAIRSKPGIHSWRWLVAGAVAAIVLAAVAAWIWPLLQGSEIQPASVERMALPLPDKPSIAVLPFANMSGDPAQDYYADGITDDLITELSKVSGLFVISRNSSFMYKGRTIPPNQVSEELGVRYVLEGSVQRAGDRLRINAQLIDALSGGHAWADRFDGSLGDVFDLQDKVTRAVADALALTLTPAEQLALGEQETRVPAAYDAFLRGWLHYRQTTAKDFAKAIPYFEEAVKLDPEYGRAYAALAIVHVRIVEKYWSDWIGLTMYEATKRANHYLAEAKKRPTTLYYQAAGIFRWIDSPLPGAADAGSDEIKKAIALDSGDPLSYAYLGATRTAAGKPEEAILHIRTAMRLDPYAPADFTYFLGLAQLSLERFDEAAASFETATKLNPENETPFIALGIAYAYLGRLEEAKAAIAHFTSITVGYGWKPLALTEHPWLGYRVPKDVERVRKGLRLAGVPETLYRGEYAERNGLTAGEVRELLFGHRLHGRTIYPSGEHAAAITKEGAVTASGDWGTITDGVSEFEDDRLCVEQGDYLRICIQILRIPGGTRTKENEYLWIARGREYTFSQVE